MQLYIIRHAQSYNNALADQRDRVKDPHLTELGLKQAAAVADYLTTGAHPEQKFGSNAEATGVQTIRGFGLTRLYCSAMYRAMQTAQPISQALDLTPEIWLDIHEAGGIFLDHRDERGVVGYPGMTRDEILAEFPDYILPPEITADGWWNVNAGQEDWSGCQARAIRVARRLRKWAAAEYAEERLAIVSHGGFIASLLKALINQLPGDHVIYHHFNTAITRIDFRDAHTLDVRYINRIPHLSQEMVS